MHAKDIMRKFTHDIINILSNNVVNEVSPCDTKLRWMANPLLSKQIITWLLYRGLTVYIVGCIMILFANVSYHKLDYIGVGHGNGIGVDEEQRNEDFNPLRPSDTYIISSDNGLSPSRRQAIIWTNAWILLIGPVGANFSEILIEIYTFPFMKMQLKASSAKWWPCCLGLNVLTIMTPLMLFIHG